MLVIVTSGSPCWYVWRGTLGEEMFILHVPAFIPLPDIFISEFKSVASVLSSNSTENLMIHVLDNKVLFETEDLTISTTRLDEKMPDYNSVLPKYSDSLIVGRLALKNAVKMASTAIGNVGKELALKIDVSDMETKLSIQDIDLFELNEAFASQCDWLFDCW